MTANGNPIGDYSFRPSAATITYTLAYEEEQARIYAGMTPAEYDNLAGTPQWVNVDTGQSRSKCHLIVLYRMSNTIPAVANDASARESERLSKHRH